MNSNNKDKVAVLAIAYHNMGVEQEFLRSYPAAILSYKKAVNFAEKNLGEEDGITLNLRSVYENAKNEVSLIFQFLTLYSSTWLCLRRERKAKPRSKKFLRMYSIRTKVWALTSRPATRTTTCRTSRRVQKTRSRRKTRM